VASAAHFTFRHVTEIIERHDLIDGLEADFAFAIRDRYLSHGPFHA